MLNLLRPHMIQPFRNAEAITLLHMAVGAAGRPAVLLLAGAHIEHPDTRARRLIADFFGAPVRRDRLPEDFERWIRRHEKRLLGPGDDAPLRVNLSSSSATKPF